MRSLIRTRRRKVAVALLALALIASSVAYAAWLFTGSGDTTFQNDASITVTVEGVPVSGSVLPGESTDVKVDVSHDYSGTLNVSDAVIDPPTSSDPDCDEDVYWIANSNGSSPSAIPSGAATEVTLANAISLAADAPQGCEDSLLTVPVTITLSNE